MDNVYILHGCCDREEFEDLSVPSGSNFHWIPWLQKQLIVSGYNCQTPEMPAPYKADYNSWSDIFSSFPINERTSLIAHSCGCGFFLRYLADNPSPINKLILVAPWLDPNNKMGDFLSFELSATLTEQIKELHILYSTDERVGGVKESVDHLLKTYPSAHYHEFEDKGHFCLSEMGTNAFPELLELIL